MNYNFGGKIKLDEDQNVVVLKDFPPNKIVHDVWVVWVGSSYFMTPVTWITTPRISPVLQLTTQNHWDR